MSEPDSFTQRLWREIEPVYARIREHPFLLGLASGGLDEGCFRHYVTQDAVYLRSFARGLALLASRSEDDDELKMFCEHAAVAIDVERALHAGFLRNWAMTFEEALATEPAPNCLLYTSYLLRVAYSRPYYEAIGAFLPCYWIYFKVGEALQPGGSSNALYQQWIDTYAGEAFALTVREILALTERLASGLTEAQRDAMATHVRRTARLEWMFWDMAYQRQGWPV